MPQLKIATFNVEWMISVFGGVWKTWDGTIPTTFPGKNLGGIKLAPIQDVRGLCKRIAGVIEAVDPDILGIEEGPPLKAQMELFVKRYLNNKYTVFQSNERRQSVFALVRKSLAHKTTHVPYTDTALKLLSWHVPILPVVGLPQRGSQEPQIRPYSSGVEIQTFISSRASGDRRSHEI